MKNKTLITEDTLDGVTRTIVRDIITIFKKNKEGEFGLPEDLDSERMTYEFSRIPTDFSIFLTIEKSDDVESFDVDGEYSEDDDLIIISITTNPESDNKILYELIGDLNEVVRHELEHIKQMERGYDFPKKEPKKPFKYYSQEHELQAQRKGLKRSARIRNLDYETVIRNWFEKNKHKHKLKPKQVEVLVQKILSEK